MLLRFAYEDFIADRRFRNRRYFRWDWTEEVVKEVAKEKYNVEISSGIDGFLMSFELIRIQREYDENGNLKNTKIQSKWNIPKKFVLKNVIVHVLTVRQEKDVNPYSGNE